LSYPRGLQPSPASRARFCNGGAPITAERKTRTIGSLSSQTHLKREQPEVALITDVRFPNEVDAIHALGGYAVKVTRTTAPDVKVHEHASESVLDGFNGWDFTIEAATLHDLRKQAVAIYRQLEKKQNVKAIA
jgi:hypothetical protein